MRGVGWCDVCVGLFDLVDLYGWVLIWDICIVILYVFG